MVYNPLSCPTLDSYVLRYGVAYFGICHYSHLGHRHTELHSIHLVSKPFCIANNGSTTNLVTLCDIPKFLHLAIQLIKYNAMKKYRCTACDYIYDPVKGDPENGIPAGTPFEKLPEDWACPICGLGKEVFEVEE